MAHIIGELVENEIKVIDEIRNQLDILVNEDTGKMRVERNTNGSYGLYISMDDKVLNINLTVKEIYDIYCKSNNRIDEILERQIIFKIRNEIMKTLQNE